MRKNLLIAFAGFCIFLSSIPLITYFYFASTLVSKESILNQKDTGVTLLDNQNQPFFAFYEAKTDKEIQLSEIPIKTQQAIIAIEDRSFYTHPGFSVRGIIRSLIDDIQGRSLMYGGSTITQQLVKNSLLTPNKDIFRKIQEIILANEIERRYSKNEILAMYLNSVYFGEGAFGIEKAAQIYFNKPTNELTLGESALLAAILPTPTRLSLKNGKFDEAKKRQKTVLQKMFEQGFISALEKEHASQEEIVISSLPDQLNTIAPHFALMVKDELIQKYGEEQISRSGFKVKTTLNLQWQQFAEKTVQQQVDKLKINKVGNGAAVVLDPKTSEIKAMVGSSNWYDDTFGKVNITLSPRQPGSAFKPIVYMRAFEKNLITPLTALHDTPTTFANFDEKTFYSTYSSKEIALAALKNDPNAYYKPEDFDRKTRGVVSVRRALANSLNIPTVEVIKKVGVEDTLEFSKQMGITTLQDPSNYGLSLALGTGNVMLLELSNAYAVFANGGMKNNPVSILEITDKMGNLVFKYNNNPQKVLDGKHAFLISSILSDNKARSEVFGTALNISRPAAVKTGTTENFKDAWTIGYTPSLLVGVWVGNNFGEPMDNVAGSLGAAPIWKLLMEEFLKGAVVEEFTIPQGVLKVTNPCLVDDTRRIATSAGSEDFIIEGTQSIPTCLPKPATSPTKSPAPTSTISPQIIIDMDNRGRGNKDNIRNNQRGSG